MFARIASPSFSLLSAFRMQRSVMRRSTVLPAFHRSYSTEATGVVMAKGTKRTPGDGQPCRIVVITSGKGGVGKTTTSASFAYGLASQGFKVCAIDFDIGLRNLDLHLGCERRVVFDFVNVINGECQLHQALIKDKRCPSLSMLAASQTRDKSVLTEEGVGRVIDQLRKEFEFVVCDSPAGIEQGAHQAMYFADDALMCTNPELSSVRDADKMIGILTSKSQRAITKSEAIRQFLLITRYSPERVAAHNMLSVKDIADMLGIPLVGVIPESEEVLHNTNLGQPVVLGADDAAAAYKDTVLRFLGQDRPLQYVSPKPKGILKRLFG
uniref:Mitochondrial MinD n=1 Tax=Malawimonas californiana TaxID=221722 RepID=A0A0E3SU87_MALCL|nr:mitochondrial MinD [Malawimonas californiana]